MGARHLGARRRVGERSRCVRYRIVFYREAGNSSSCFPLESVFVSLDVSDVRGFNQPITLIRNRLFRWCSAALAPCNSAVVIDGFGRWESGPRVLSFLEMHQIAKSSSPAWFLGCWISWMLLPASCLPKCPSRGALCQEEEEGSQRGAD